MSTNTKSDPRLGDLCVKLMHLTSASEQYSCVIDLYNMYVVTGCRTIAKRHVDHYAGTEELNVSAIPIQTFDSEWNKSLLRFHDTVMCKGKSESAVSEESHTRIVTEVVEHALKKVNHVTVPIDSVTYLEQLYKSAPVRECVFPPNGPGVTLALIWAMSENELFDRLHNRKGCYYLHLATQTKFYKFYNDMFRPLLGTALG
ncbi:hypothetical protein CRENBAI_012160 [Crenichthys baileyi]|uniref:Uncharacterized protein n=1 Tax=Crenichthys baileyi TaxID=28760 RepID=A0AAV9RUN8_9TELE